MRYIRIKIFICFVVFIFSCNKEKNKLAGWWAIDTITVDGVDRKIDLSVNTFTFEKDGYVRLPLFELKGTNDGKWRVERDEDDRYLIIESSDNILAGRYRLFYFKDPKKKLYRMSLQSDGIQMVCSKGLQTYKE